MRVIAYVRGYAPDAPHVRHVGYDSSLLPTSPVGEIIDKAKKAVLMKEKIHEANTMSSFLDKHISDQIRRYGAIPLENHRFSVVFWDIRGFSSLCEILKTSPTLISDFLIEYNAAAVKLISENDGIIDKFIGDGVMAIFGYKQSDDCGAYGSVRTALQLRGEFEKIKAKHIRIWQRSFANSINISLGCGIHLGDVLFGEIGSKDRKNITAVGGVVNFSARLEGRAKDGQILISSTVLAHLDGKVAVGDCESIDDVKNISGTFNYYKVLGLNE